MDKEKIISLENLNQYSEETSGKIKKKIAEHTDNTNVHVTTADKSKWNNYETKIEQNKTDIQNLQNQDNVLSSRIDNIATLPEGSTTADAELADIRVGADGTTYESAGTAVRTQVSKLKQDLDELANNIDNDKKAVYLNLFDMNNIIDDAYIGDSGETVNGNRDFFITDFIKIDIGETITVDTLHLVDHSIWFCNWAKAPIKKVTLTNGKWRNDETENGYIRFCYQQRILTEKVIYKQRILFVGKGGYSTINEAISDCNDGDIIYVRSGVYYNENNTADSTNGFKRYYLVGESRESTIVINNDGNYLTGAFCFRGYSIENLTIINKRYNNTIPSSPAYALHTDFAEVGDKMVIRNCHFESHYTSAVGIGTAKDCDYIFENCSFVTKSDGLFDRGAVFFHNATNSSYNGNPITGDNQKLSFINCTFTTDTNIALSIDSLDIQNNNLTVSFINNNLYASRNDNATPVPISASKMNGIPIDQPNYYKYLCGWFVTKHNRSYGNNVEMLNAGKPIVVI